MSYSFSGMTFKNDLSISAPPSGATSGSGGNTVNAFDIVLLTEEHETRRNQPISAPPSEATSGSGGNTVTNESDYILHDSNTFSEIINLSSVPSGGTSGSGGNTVFRVDDVIISDEVNGKHIQSLFTPASESVAGDGGKEIEKIVDYICHDENRFCAYLDLGIDSDLETELFGICKQNYNFRVFDGNVPAFSTLTENVELHIEEGSGETIDECGNASVHTNAEKKHLLVEGVIPERKKQNLKEFGVSENIWHICTKVASFDAIVERIEIEDSGRFIEGEVINKNGNYESVDERMYEFSMKFVPARQNN